MQIKVNKKIRRVCSIVWKDVSSVVFLKTATNVDDFIVCGRSFHACGPAKAKARLPNSVQGFGTTRLSAAEERNHCLAATAIIGIHSSARYDGTRLCRALYTVRHSLNSMRCGTRSQWRSCSMSDMWSFFQRREMTPAAAFMMEIWQSSENVVAVVDSRQHHAIN